MQNWCKDHPEKQIISDLCAACHSGSQTVCCMVSGFSGWKAGWLFAIERWVESGQWLPNYFSNLASMPFPCWGGLVEEHLLPGATCYWAIALPGMEPAFSSLIMIVLLWGKGKPWEEAQVRKVQLFRRLLRTFFDQRQEHTGLWLPYSSSQCVYFSVERCVNSTRKL